MLTVDTEDMTKRYTSLMKESITIPYSHFGIPTELFTPSSPSYNQKEQKNSFEQCFAFMTKEMTFQYGNWRHAKRNV